MSIWSWWAIAAGGALGAVARFAVSHQVYVWFGRDFAWGTLAVNVAGSFAMGLLAVLLIDKWSLSNEWRSFILVGFLGAFTTFSTFSYETMQYIQVGEMTKAVANMALSLILTLSAVWLGMIGGRQFLAS
ncbi:fluoride efflux transporter CrcB [Thiomicrorhabdus xiamenensis]|uniref:Fluoride-specific ion channel FluC n=1 Tax=Thiomicrorhabdus xiamenensis TaxID=2739063 RepID=A0A7D4P5A6_9GAMM|nr:fluoride efflux transporter CrcB [Thiomicrorhabdus xiamenensis]QKI89515.1 fluoride efflux transporter CrcB [Thiomicrorhabdus xiamenensis]